MGQKKKKRVSFFFSNPLRLANKAILASRAGVHYSIVFLPCGSNFCLVAKSQIFGEEAVALLLLHPPFQLASLRQGMGGQFIVAAVDRREGILRTLAWVVGSGASDARFMGIRL